MSKIKGFVGETLIYGFGNVFSRIFAMMLIPLYAKYLGKIDYSNLVMLQSTFTILTFLLALNAGVFYYYYEYENLKYRKIVLTSWFYYQVVIALIIFVSLFAFSPWILNIFVIQDGNQEVVRWCLVLVGLQLFPYIFNVTNINYFRIERKPKSVIIIVLLEALFTIIFVFISLSILNGGLLGVLFAQIIARIFVSLIFIKYSKLYLNARNFSRKIIKKIILYTWPFILSSMFTWVIISVDKFIGAGRLTDKTEVALLALAMQLVLPISVLADMIRMAIGPYIMSIRKDHDAEKSYQQIFELCIFAASIVVVGIIIISPFLTLILANKSYLGVMHVIPLMALAQVISLMANQFCISFSLVKKTIYILYSIIIAGTISTVINIFFMKNYGFVVSGYSQIVSYIAMSIFLFVYGRKVANLQLKLKNSLLLLSIVISYIIALNVFSQQIENGSFLIPILIGILYMILLFIIYFKQQQLNPLVIIAAIKDKFR